jgi:hypothetical protein
MSKKVSGKQGNRRQRAGNAIWRGNTAFATRIFTAC